MSETMDAVLLNNMMQDLEEYLRDTDEKLTDQDVIDDSLGLNFKLTATEYVKTYNGNNSFMLSLKKKLLVYNRLTAPQLRAALNIWQEELHGRVEGPPQERDMQWPCTAPGCGKVFQTEKELFDHKDALHSFTPIRHHPDCTDHRHKRDQVCPLPSEQEMHNEPVIENRTGLLKLDLSNLPDGRYAVPDLSGKNDYCFLMVKRVRHSHLRDRRYVYGKVLTGNEFVEAGTIEIKEWSSDAKRLCGEQRPGGHYKGEFEVELQAVLAAPQPWAILFGQMIGRCGICGKTLTDDISRSDGVGPECVKKLNEGYFGYTPESFIKRNEAGTPWCEKHNEYHWPQAWCLKK